MAHSVTLTWTASTDAAVTGYNVYRSLVAGGEVAPAVNAAPIAADTYQDTSIPAPGSYYYVVTSLANGAESVHSAEVNAKVLPFPPTNIVVSNIS